MALPNARPHAMFHQSGWDPHTIEQWGYRVLGLRFGKYDFGFLHKIWLSFQLCEQHNGEATLLIPPKGGFQSSTPRTESDAVSIRSLQPSSTIQYQCPFRWQSNLSSTDVRSTQARLRNSIASSSSNSFSTASSGVPGIGYLSGKAVKWVGSKI